MSRGSRTRRAWIGASAAATLLLVGASIAAAAEQSVNIIDYAFDPPDVSIAVGDTVTWTNTGEDTHTVKFDDGESRPLSNGDTYERTFDTAGTFAYVCGIHSSMTGSVTVAAGAGGTATPGPTETATASAEVSPGASATPSQPPTDTEVSGQRTPSAPLPVWWFAVAGIAAIVAAGLMVRRLQNR